MGTSKVPERLVWVAEALAIDPADHLLEIGCGRGVAVSLICEKLADGKITALDRSAVAIDAAKQANVKQVRSGKAAFHHTELAAFEPDGERFDKVFAVNVNLFWVRRPTPELAVIDRVLQPEGALHLFYGYGKPSTGKPGQVVDKLTVSLAERGFFIADVVTPSEGSSQMLHAMAQPRAIR